MVVWKDKLKNWKGELRRPEETEQPREGQGTLSFPDEREGVWAVVNLPSCECFS